MRAPPPSALKSMASSLPSVGGSGHAHRVMAVNLLRDSGTFSFTVTFFMPLQCKVRTSARAVNHNGFWSKPSMKSSLGSAPRSNSR